MKFHIYFLAHWEDAGIYRNINQEVPLEQPRKKIGKKTGGTEDPKQ